MSGAIIVTPATGDSWATAWEQVEYTRKGKHGVSLTNYDSDSIHGIASGSWAEVAGSIYKWTADEAISGSPVAGYINYVKLVPSGTGGSAIVTATYTTTAPTWSDAYQGWYDGTSRYVASFFYTGQEAYEKMVFPTWRTPYDVWSRRNSDGNNKKIKRILTDFTNAETGAHYGLKGWPLASGTCVMIDSATDAPNHPGIIKISSSTSASSGYYVGTSGTDLVINGWEGFETVFRVPATGITTFVYLGFNDMWVTGSTLDQVIIRIVQTTLDGRAMNNTTSSTTGSSYTISTGTWYRGLIMLNSGATRAAFFLYNMSGTLLWADNVTTNIPTARTIGVGVGGFYNGTSIINMLDVDSMDFWCMRELAR